jgi:Flp pilus assembly protein TadG
MSAKIETTRSSHPRRGTVAVVVAMVLPLLVGVLAVALDGGLLYLQRRQAQSVADAAALAGAYQLYRGSTDSTAEAASIAIGQQNGVASSSMTVTPGPKNGYLTVTVTSSQPRLFSALWGSGNMSVTAGAVARGTNIPYSTAAILVLASSGTSVTLSGTTQVTAAKGNFVVDSNSSTSILSSGSPSITTPEFDLSGGIRYSGSNPNNATATKTGQASTPDPLASVSAPSSSGMTVQRSSTLAVSGGTTTLNPGVYTGGLALSGSASVYLNPGIYYINGGGINMSGPSSILGSGVMIYNTGGGSINLSGTGSVSLNPMTTGTYAGISIFQDRSNTASATLSGGSNISNTGTFYFPSSTLTLSGTSGTAAMGAQVITNKLTFSGSAGIRVNYDNSVAGSSSLALVQ